MMNSLDFPKPSLFEGMFFNPYHKFIHKTQLVAELWLGGSDMPTSVASYLSEIVCVTFGGWLMEFGQVTA